MKKIFKEKLFEKQVLVNETGEDEFCFQALFSFANILGINIEKGKELASLETFRFAAEMLGRNVPSPFYIGFPDSVRELAKERLLFDQLFHYFVTYGIGDFSEPGHSVFEEDFKRAAFKEKVEPKTFSIITEKEAESEIKKIFDNLILSSRPLSAKDFELVKECAEVFGYDATECCSKDTLVKLCVCFNDPKFAKKLNLCDFVYFAETLNYLRYGEKSIKKLNLKSADRKLLSVVLDELIKKDSNVKDCYEKQAAWCGILHHIHYKPKTESGKNFVALMRSGKNRSAYSDFEKRLAAGDVRSAVDGLLKNKGGAAVLRKVDYLLSRCDSDEDAEYVLSKIKTENNIVLLQNLIKYGTKKSKSVRTFKFAKFNLLRIHAETEKEFSARKTILCEKTLALAKKRVEENLKENLKNKLGKVYIEPETEKIAVPMQESVSFGGFGVLPRGSVLSVNDGKIVRAFVYWEKVNDVDLSAIALGKDGYQREFSWRTMFDNQSEAIVFSGDQTSGFQGGSEYFDLDADEFQRKFPQAEYVVFCANVYSGTPFSKHVCKAGFMFRDKISSGEAFEPKTVRTAFSVGCESTEAYLFAMDLKKKSVIWLSTAKNGKQIVAGENDLSAISEYLCVTEVMNVKKLFDMMATEVVNEPEAADVIVGDGEYENSEGKEIIRSCDTDKILRLLNGERAEA